MPLAQFALLILLLMGKAAWAQSTKATQPVSSRAHQVEWKSAALHPQFSFEPNQGQAGAAVKFLARGKGCEIFLTTDEAMLVPRKAGAALGIRLVGANPAPRVTGGDPLPGVSNYFIGADSGKWTTNVAHYAKVRYEQIYPGIDLLYYGSEKQGQLEHDFIVGPGADPGRIRMRFEGARNLRLDSNGDLLLSTPAGQVRQAKPVLYQEDAGERKQIAGRYLVRQGKEVSFEVGPYDRGKPLVIDPVTFYTYFSTYLGGSGDDQPSSITVDAQGNAYVAGTTTSVDFPTNGAKQTASAGKTDVFITKLDGATGTIVYSTYLGGSDDDSGKQIEIDRSGNAYVTGTTYSTNFPVTQGAFQTKFGGQSDAFVVKLNAAGNALVYSTYLGGSDAEGASGLDVDPQGNAYVAGATYSRDFPVTQISFGNTRLGSLDGFLTKLNPTGTALVYSGYLGGRGADAVTAIALNSLSEVYVVGWTTSPNLPTSPGASRWPQLAGAIDGFMTKISVKGDLIEYISYYGGLKDDILTSVTVDPKDPATIYVSGLTESPDFPTATGKPVNVAAGQALPFDARFRIPFTVLEFLKPDVVPAATDVDDYDWSIFLPLGSPFIINFGDDPEVDWDKLLKSIQQDLDQMKNIPDIPELTPEQKESLEELLKEILKQAISDANEVARKLIDFEQLGEKIGNVIHSFFPAFPSPNGNPSGNASGKPLSPDPGVQQTAPAPQALYLIDPVTGSSGDAPQFPAGAASQITRIMGIAGGPPGSLYVIAQTNDGTLPVSALGLKPAGGPSDAYIIKFSTTAPPPPPPAVTPPAVTGVVNGASFAAGAPVSPGSIVSLFGTLLAGGNASAASTPLPNSLGGTSVSIGGKPAPLFFVSPTQINAQVPWETQPGSASVIVTSNSVPSAALSFTVAAATPAIFTFGTNRAVVQNQDYTLNNTGNPAAVGSYITAYLTGGGPLDNAVSTGAANPLSPLSSVTAPYSATIGGQAANMLFLGLAPGFVGLYQANLQVPQLSSGDYPLVITVGGAKSNAPMITVSAIQ